MRHQLIGSFAILAVASLLTVSPSSAQSIPAWLDDAITEWNDENPGTRFDFVDIKDAFIWYWVPDTDEIGGKDIRSAVYSQVQRHGYTVMDQEELVTVARPPVPSGPNVERKCWRRSFILNIREQSNTTMAGGGTGQSGQRQRMLTSMVCDAVDHWYAGFRIAQ